MEKMFIVDQVLNDLDKGHLRVIKDRIFKRFLNVLKKPKRKVR